MRLWLLAVGTLLPGCASNPDPLDQVPVIGGHPDQVDAVRAELEAFESWVGTGRVHVRSIQFVAFDEEVVTGSYDGSDATIRLNNLLPPDEARITTRHELCHALDDGESLYRSFGEPVDDIADYVEQRGADFAHLYNATSPWKREAFAEICEALPPLAAELLSQSCTMTEGSEQAAKRVKELVWTEAPNVTRIGLGPRVTYTLPADEFPSQVLIYATEDPDVLLLDLVGGRGVTGFGSIWVDRASGELALGFPNSITMGEASDWPSLDPPIPGSVGVIGEEPWFVGTLFVDVEGLGRSDGRLLIRHGTSEVWRPLHDGCRENAAGYQRSVFQIDGQIWVGGIDERTVWWAPVRM